MFPEEETSSAETEVDVCFAVSRKSKEPSVNEEEPVG